MLGVKRKQGDNYQTSGYLHIQFLKSVINSSNVSHEQCAHNDTYHKKYFSSKEGVYIFTSSSFKNLFQRSFDVEGDVESHDVVAQVAVESKA